MSELVVIPWRDGAQLAFGLGWVALPGIDRRTPIDEAREAIEEAEIDSPWVGILEMPKRNYYASWPAKQRLAKAGTFPALALASKSLTEESLIYLPLADGRVWLAVAGGDRELRHTKPDRVLAEATALDDLNELMTAHSGRQGTAPLKLRVLEGHDLASNYSARAKPFTLEELFGTPARVSDLRIKRAIPSKLRFLPLISVCSAILGFAWLYKDVNQQRADAEESQEKAQIVAQYQPTKADYDLRDVRIAEAVTRALAADTAHPDPNDVLDACWQAAREAAHGIGYWTTTVMQCDGRQLSFVLTRPNTAGWPNATTRTLLDAAERGGYSAGIDASGNSATVTKALLDLPARPAITRREELPVHAEWVRSNQADFQSMAHTRPWFEFTTQSPIPSSITFADPTTRDPQGVEQTVPVPPEHQYQTTTIDTRQITSHTVPDHMLYAPWMRLDRIEFAVDSIHLSATNHFTVLTR